MGRSAEELASFFDRLDRHERLGICLDSCHWWVSGVDVTSPDALDEALAELDGSIGLDRSRFRTVNVRGCRPAVPVGVAALNATVYAPIGSQTLDVVTGCPARATRVNTRSPAASNTDIRTADSAPSATVAPRENWVSRASPTVSVE